MNFLLNMVDTMSFITLLAFSLGMFWAVNLGQMRHEERLLREDVSEPLVEDVEHLSAQVDEQERKGSLGHAGRWSSLHWSESHCLVVNGC